MKIRLTLVIALLLIACEQPAPTPSPPRPALVVTVGERTTAPPTILVGEVRSRYESAQGFRIAGKIVARHVEVGTRVKQNDLLARLDSTDSGLSAQASRAEVSAAEADLALAQAELARQRQLHEHQFISAQALDMTEAKFKATEARVKQARAQAEVDDNQTRYTDLRADRNGIVTDIHAEPGQVVEAGEVIAHIAVPDTLEVVIAVPESRMFGIMADTPAEIRLWAEPGVSYRGRVREVSPAADSVTRTFQVRVAFLATDNEPRMGMTAGVRFQHQDSRDYLLPLPAVTQRDDRPVVWIVDSRTGQVQPKPVEIGLFSEEGVLIRAGLNDGDQVVVAGAHALVPGQVVRPQPVRSE